MRLAAHLLTACITGNVALFGAFAGHDPGNFPEPLKREGDPVALGDFQKPFRRT